MNTDYRKSQRPILLYSGKPSGQSERHQFASGFRQSQLGLGEPERFVEPGGILILVRYTQEHKAGARLACHLDELVHGTCPGALPLMGGIDNELVDVEVAFGVFFRVQITDAFPVKVYGKAPWIPYRLVFGGGGRKQHILTLFFRDVDLRESVNAIQRYGEQMRHADYRPSYKVSLMKPPFTSPCTQL